MDSFPSKTRPWDSQWIPFPAKQGLGTHNAFISQQRLIGLIKTRAWDSQCINFQNLVFGNFQAKTWVWDSQCVTFQAKSKTWDSPKAKGVSLITRRALPSVHYLVNSPNKTIRPVMFLSRMVRWILFAIRVTGVIFACPLLKGTSGVGARKPIST